MHRGVFGKGQLSFPQGQMLCAHAIDEHLPRLGQRTDPSREVWQGTIVIGAACWMVMVAMPTVAMVMVCGMGVFVGYKMKTNAALSKQKLVCTAQSVC